MSGLLTVMFGVMFLFSLMTWLSAMDNNDQASKACIKQGYAGGRYDTKQGFVCWREIPQGTTEKP